LVTGQDERLAEQLLDRADADQANQGIRTRAGPAAATRRTNA